MVWPMVNVRVGSVSMSAVKCLNASAKSLDASAKYFGCVGSVLVASAAQDWSPRQGYCFGDTFRKSKNSLMFNKYCPYDTCNILINDNE